MYAARNDKWTCIISLQVSFMNFKSCNSMMHVHLSFRAAYFLHTGLIIWMIMNKTLHIIILVFYMLKCTNKTLCFLVFFHCIISFFILMHDIGMVDHVNNFIRFIKYINKFSCCYHTLHLHINILACL